MDKASEKKVARTMADKAEKLLAFALLAKSVSAVKAAMADGKPNDDDANVSLKSKVNILRACNSAILYKSIGPDSPLWDSMLKACIPEHYKQRTFDNSDPDQVGDITRMLRGTTDMVETLVRAYTHELGHARVGEAMHEGSEGVIRILVRPFAGMHKDEDGDERIGMGFNIASATCRFSGRDELPAATKAAISCAGVMAEYGIAAHVMADEDGIGPLADVGMWLKLLRAAKTRAERGEDADDDGDGESGEDVVYAMGADDDALTFFKFAPTEKEQRVAIRAAAKVLVEHGTDLMATAIATAVQHAGALAKALDLMALAQRIAEKAAEGEFADVAVQEVKAPTSTIQ